MKRLFDFKDYAAAADKLEALKLDRSTAERKRDSLLAAINNRQTTRPDPVAEAAQQLVDGKRETTARPSLDSLRDQYAQACHTVRIHHAAVALQEGRVDSIRSARSAEVCKSAAGEYSGLVKAAVAAAVALSRAYQAAQDFRSNLSDDGVIVDLPQLPAHLNALGRWSDPHSNVHQTITEARTAGYVSGEYNDRPQAAGPYDTLPKGGIEALAAGPDGVRRVQVERGGNLKTTKWLYQSEPNSSNSDGWQ